MAVHNLYTEWLAAKDDVWFSTRSLFPDLDYYLAPNPLLKCSNYPCHFYDEFTIDEVLQYFIVQIAILRFNNPSFSKDQISTSISSRIIYWKGNVKLNKDPYFIRELVPQAIKEVFMMENYQAIIEMDHTKHWYGDRIEKLPNQRDGKTWGEKTKVKQQLRAKYNSEIKVEFIKEACQEYRFNNFNVLPTVKYLIDETGYSGNTVRTHGKEYFIGQMDNSKQRINTLMKLYPYLKQKEIAEKADVSLRTVERYVKETKKTFQMQII